MSIIAPPPSTHPHTHALSTRTSRQHLRTSQGCAASSSSESSSSIFAASGAATAHAELPQALAQPTLPVPFPTYTQRHTSPYPMSFSSLGTGPLTPDNSPPMPPHGLPLHVSQPPSAPKVELNDLPVLSPDLGSSPEADPMVPTPIQVYDYAIRPKPSFRVLRPKTSINGKLVPDTMVKLAPPADELLDYAFQQPAGEAVQAVVLDSYAGTPRRSEDSLLGVHGTQSLVLPPPPGSSSADEDLTSSATPVGRSRSDGNKKSSNRRSMGPPPRPKRASTAYPGQLPTSANVQPTHSAESRQRLRNSMVGMLPRTHTYHSQPSSAHSTISRGIDVGAPPRPFTLAGAASGVSDEDEPDLGGPEGIEAKVVLLGSQGAGKTSLILRYTTRTFSENSAPATIGSSLHTRKLVHEGTRVKLQIWDTAGQERFRSMAPIYYRGAHVCVLVYGITDRQSFEDVRSWLEELGRTVPKETVIYVVGAKTDLEGSKRVVSFEEARRNIRLWTRPASPPVREEILSPPPTRSLLRSPSVSSGTDQPVSVTPTRSYSHTALASYDGSSRSQPTSAAGTPARHSSMGHTSKPAKPIIKTTKSARPSLTSPTSPRGVHFPALQSPSRSTQATTTEHVQPSMPTISAISPTGSRHGVSGGRYSISGILGMSRTESMSGAAMNLARLAEENPADPQRRSGSPMSFNGRPPLVSPRIRTESSPLLHSPPAISGRRRSEEWSARSWRMGEGPSAAEALNEFGAGVRRRESGEMLSRSNGSAGSGGPSGMIGTAYGHGQYQSQSQSLGSASGGAASHGYSGPHSAVSTPGSSGVQFPRSANNGASTPGSTKGGSLNRSRSRGGSMGSASRLYLSENEAEEKEWGVDVGGIRLGECSALTGDGVEALFKSISSLLVEKKDKIARDRDLRKKGSVMLVDLDKDAPSSGKPKGNCCI